MKKFLKIICGILVVCLILGLIGFGVYKYKTSTSGNLDIVIIGIDSREGIDGARSDSLMVAHIDSDHKELHITSIPRDSYVYIPSQEREDKITHAYAYTGKEGTLETLDRLLDKDFKYYVEVDFEKLIKLVDDIGGIELTPSATFCEMNEKDQADSYCFNEGETIKMDGAQALAYSRHRKSDSDIYRAGRQQEVVKAMLKKIKAMNLKEMYDFYQKVVKVCDTNVDLGLLLGYLDMAFNDFKLEEEVAKGTGDYMYNEYYGQQIAYYFLDEDYLITLKQQLQK